MGNEIQIFNNPEFGAIRTLDIEGKTYFVGGDVAKALGYARPADAISAHCKGSVKHRVPTKGGKQEVKIIPEGDLYRLITHSELPAAEKFESWVFDEVLPSIRKTGMYSTTRPPQPDASSAKRAEASLLNAKARAAKLLYEIASNSSNELYRQAGEAIAMNMLAGQKVIDMPEAEQRPNHELGYFCQFIGKAATWASTLGKKLKAAGMEKNAETGVFKVIWDKQNNQRDSFYWYDDVLLPKLRELFPVEYVASAED